MAIRNKTLGELVHETSDDLGRITVYQQDNLRYLTFGNQVEQSCLNLEKPFRLEHTYTQAMMLALLLSQPAAPLLQLGLGGGGLVRAIQHAYPGISLQAVELREAVIRVARDYFAVSDSNQLQLICSDALGYLENCPHRYGIIFSDLYLAEQVHESQQQAGFYIACREKLSANGLLVINQWSGEFATVLKSQQALKQVFDEQVFNLHVQGGNHVSFAFKGELPSLDRKAFFEAAQKLGMLLDIPLQRLARNFWQQNAQAMKVRHYRTHYSL